MPRIAQNSSPLPVIRKIKPDIDWESLGKSELKTRLTDELALRRKKGRESVPDYDMFRVRDAQEVGEYVEEIFQDMKSKQKDYHISQDFHDHSDRAQIIDFIEELHAIFDLIPETLFISIQVFDRFLSKEQNQKEFKDLQ